jgi:S1-C subfamily serine protease
VTFEFDLPVKSGVVVTDINRRTPAARVVTTGDVIVKINGKDIDSVQQAQKELKRGGYSLDLVINRRGSLRRIMLR